MMEVRLDELPGGHENATVVFWHVEEGDRVEEGEELVKLSVDGKPFTFTSPIKGIVHEIYIDEGEEIHLGDVLSILEEEIEDLDVDEVESEI